MPGFYDQDIIQVVAASDRPLRHRDIAERIAPGDSGAWSNIGISLTKLYRYGVLKRSKLDGRRYHYTIGDVAARLTTEDLAFYSGVLAALAVVKDDEHAFRAIVGAVSEAELIAAARAHDVMDTSGLELYGYGQ